jgi:hypothetical protein
VEELELYYGEEEAVSWDGCQRRCHPVMRGWWAGSSKSGLRSGGLNLPPERQV